MSRGSIPELKQVIPGLSRMCHEHSSNDVNQVSAYEANTYSEKVEGSTQLLVYPSLCPCILWEKVFEVKYLEITKSTSQRGNWAPIFRRIKGEGKNNKLTSWVSRVSLEERKNNNNNLQNLSHSIWSKELLHKPRVLNTLVIRMIVLVWINEWLWRGWPWGLGHLACYAQSERESNGPIETCDANGLLGGVMELLGVYSGWEDVEICS